MNTNARTDSTRNKWKVKLIFMSEDEHDLSDGKEYNTREAALIGAMDMVEKEAIVEYGVIDLDGQPPEEEDDWLSEDVEMSKVGDE